MAQPLRIARRKCGKFDFDLPVFGLGGWAFGSGDYWGKQEQQDINEVVDLGLSVGANFFDTAEGYDAGKAEEALGNAIKGKQGVLVGSKVLPQNCTPQKLRQSLDKSLARLHATSVFIYMVHWPTDTHKSPEGTPASDIPHVTTCFETLKELQKEGKIVHIGVSNFGVKQLKDALQTGVKIVLNQLPYGLFLRSVEFEILPFCQHEGIGVIAYSPLLQGILSGKYESIDAIPDYRTRTRHFKGTRNRSRHGGPGCEEEIVKALGEIRQVADSLKVSMSTLALAWTCRNPAITCVIPGARTTAQLRENLKATELVLSDDVYQKLQQISEPIKAHLGKYVDIYESAENQRTSF